METQRSYPLESIKLKKQKTFDGWTAWMTVQRKEKIRRNPKAKTKKEINSKILQRNSDKDNATKGGEIHNEIKKWGRAIERSNRDEKRGQEIVLRDGRRQGMAKWRKEKWRR